MVIAIENFMGQAGGTGIKHFLRRTLLLPEHYSAGLAR